MKNLSRWAARHSRVAIGLIILIELVNAYNGTLLGANLLEGWSDAALQTCLAAVLLLRTGFQFLVERQRIQGVIQARAALFAFNFLLFTLLGGVAANRTTDFHPSGTAGGGAFSSRSDTLIVVGDTLAPAPPVVKKAGEPDKPNQKEDKVLLRITYALLFIAGLLLAYLAGGLACGLACSGYGFFAVVVLLLATGILAGGFYFLGKAVRKGVKRFREMTLPERKREGRRYLRTLAVTVGVLALYFLMITLSN